MKKSSKIVNKLFIAAATVATTLFAGCQQESDEILGNINGLDYRIHDNMTYTEMWDVLWKGFNQNYVGWETETIDWDEANATIRPQLEELDDKVKACYDDAGNILADADTAYIIQTAEKLYRSAFDSLHDGHLKVHYKDPLRQQYVKIRPWFAQINKNRTYYPDDFEFASIDKTYYSKKGDISDEGIFYYDCKQIVHNFIVGSILDKMRSDVQKFNTNTSEDEAFKKKWENCISLIENIEKYADGDIGKFQSKFLSDVFGNATSKAIMGVYGIKESYFNIDRPKMQMFFTKDNIAYFWLSSFLYWPNEKKNYDSNTLEDVICGNFWNNLQAWHDKVYKLHAEGKLKGVVLDVRGNHGGESVNLKNFAGLLFKGDKHQLGTQKFKNGIGRLDYTVPVPFYLPCCGSNSEDITEPIVILTNIGTVSCAELSTAAVKQHKNGVSIGTTTAGAGAGLIDKGVMYSKTNYSGTIGIEDLTTVYARIPMVLTYYDGGIGNIECKGIAPDIEVSFKEELYKSTGCDNQFDRAIDYIRSTGK